MKLQTVVQLIAVVTFCLTTACSNKDSEEAKIANLENEILRIEKENEDLRKQNGDKGLVAKKPVAQYDNSFLKNFCSLVKNDISAEDLEPYFTNPRGVERALESIKHLAKDVNTCEFKQMKFYDHPFDMAEYKTDKGYLYIQSTYNTQFKVRWIMNLSFEYPVEMSVHNVKMRDGKKLLTYLIHRAGKREKRGTIFLRSPYMIYGSLIAQSYLATHFNKNMVIQANRGSHNSEGHFRWLEKMNIDDSYDTIDWITNRPESNGKVMAYGVSYDGFDALATAASNHKALKSVIACSAPANAATDSFTSDKFVENGIFGYVTTDRRNETAFNAQQFFEFINTESSAIGRSRMDDILTGLDSKEWNLTNLAIDDKNHSYWSDRQILTELETAKMPIAHVAGLVRDQDGRDTVLGYLHMQKYSPFKNQNFLVLHKDGHGCGDFFRKHPLSRALIQMTDSESEFVSLGQISKVSHYTLKKDDYEYANSMEEIPLETETIDFADEMELEDFIFMNVKDPSKYSSGFVVPIEEATNLNGVPRMKIYYTSNTHEVPVHISFAVISPEGELVKGTRGWRTGFIGEKTEFPKFVDLTFPLVNGKVPAGSQMIVQFSTRNPRVFLRQPKAKMEVSEPTVGLAPSIKILSNQNFQSQLYLPTEI